MLPENRDLEYLRHILIACRSVERLTAAGSYQRLINDEDFQLALLHAIQLVGEGARRVSGAFKQAHPEIDWPKIIAQRNVIVHDYTGIDYEVIWSDAISDVPRVIELLQPLLPRESS